MATFRIDKVVAALPGTLTPDTVYAVRAGAGFDLYISDSTGTTAHALNASAGFLDVPDEVDQSDPTFFYFGWESVNGGWLVQRQLRTTGATERSTTGFADLTTAWPNRSTLGYV